MTTDYDGSFEQWIQTFFNECMAFLLLQYGEEQNMNLKQIDSEAETKKRKMRIKAYTAGKDRRDNILFICNYLQACFGDSSLSLQKQVRQISEQGMLDEITSQLLEMKSLTQAESIILGVK